MSNICKCWKGYSCQNKNEPQFGMCKPCYLKTLTRAKRKKYEYEEYLKVHAEINKRNRQLGGPGR